jgi:ABC-2 type transport system ATP-binding protein
MIRINELNRSFGKTAVVRNCSFELNEAAVYGLIGLNGAGKTTLIRVMLGHLKADSGSVELLGRNPWKHQSSLFSTLGVVMEHSGLADSVTLWENLLFFGRARGLRAQDISHYLKEYWSHLEPMVGKKVRHFSRGERMQAAICRAFMGWPALCILDEPTVALDVEAYERFCNLIRSAKTHGCTIFMSSHQLEAIEELCDGAGVLAQGSIEPIEQGVGTQGALRWSIRLAGQFPGAAELLAPYGAESVQQQGQSINFTLKQELLMPRIVEVLVQAGAQIVEVRSQRESLRLQIRNRLE